MSEPPLRPEMYTTPSSFIPPSGSFVANPYAYSGEPSQLQSVGYPTSTVTYGQYAPPVGTAGAYTYPSYTSYVPPVNQYVSYGAAAAPRSSSFTTYAPANGVPTSGSFTVSLPQRTGSFQYEGSGSYVPPVNSYVYPGSNMYSSLSPSVPPPVLGSAYGAASTASFATPIGGSAFGMQPPVPSGSFSATSTPQFKFYPEKSGAAAASTSGLNGVGGAGSKPSGVPAPLPITPADRSLPPPAVVAAVQKKASKKKKQGGLLGCC